MAPKKKKGPDAYKQSGVSFQGVGRDKYEMAMKLQKFFEGQEDMAAKMSKRYDEINSKRKKSGDLEAFLNGELAEQKQILADIEEYRRGNLDLTQKTLKAQKQIKDDGKEQGDAITDMIPGVGRINDSYKMMKGNLQKMGLSFGVAGIAAGLAIAVKLAEKKE